ncbi:MAG TPA: hexitol phosphatase HxpB [Candidatus Saccharimonadales bacterium]|nr:hexitol phosphatase HxpB [Candidatus Saccharimonadales bacterium]
MIKAAIFDMDGLLIDSEPFWHEAETAVFKTVGITPTEEDFIHCMGRRNDEVVAYYYDKQPWQNPSQQDIVTMILDSVAAQVKQKGRLLPGVKHAFDVCKAAKLPMALASGSNNVIIDTVVDTLGIRDNFAHLYSAEHELYGKPDPGVFLTTAKLLGVKPVECLVFEDSPNGVKAAKAAGMRCVAVPDPAHKDHESVQGADIIIDSLEQFDASMLE